jgi:hypothetical protein
LWLVAHYPLRAWIGIWNGIQGQAMGGKWDWLDILATLLGGLIGQAVQAFIIYLIIK